jgi:histo-blood group ABO system transferase
MLALHDGQEGVLDVPRVALCVIATGKYHDFLERLIQSAKRFLLPNCLVSYVIFSDKQPPWESCHAWYRVEHLEWPGPTLFRYHWMLRARRFLERHEFVYYCDVDMEFVDVVGGNALGNLVAVTHQGYVDQPIEAIPFEQDPNSRAYIDRKDGTTYYAGGFQGGRLFLRAIHSMVKAIDEDRQIGKVAVWHDESHWNRYLLDHPPDIVLPPDYCCAEGRRCESTKLIALNKDHDTIRHME